MKTSSTLSSSFLENAKEVLDSVMDERSENRESVHDGQTRGLVSSNIVEPFKENLPSVVERERMNALESSKPSLKERTQPCDSAFGDSLPHQDEIETVPDGNLDRNYHNLIDGFSSLEAETSLRSYKGQVADVSAYPTLPSPASEKSVLPEEIGTKQSHVPNIASRYPKFEDSSR